MQKRRKPKAFRKSERSIQNALMSAKQKQKEVDLQGRVLRISLLLRRSR